MGTWGNVFDLPYTSIQASQVVLAGKNTVPGMSKTWVWSLGQEDPLEEGMATHSSIPAWRIPWAEEPGGAQGPHVLKESDMTEAT